MRGKYKKVARVKVERGYGPRHALNAQEGDEDVAGEVARVGDGRHYQGGTSDADGKGYAYKQWIINKIRNRAYDYTYGPRSPDRTRADMRQRVGSTNNPLSTGNVALPQSDYNLFTPAERKMYGIADTSWITTGQPTPAGSVEGYYGEQPFTPAPAFAQEQGDYPASEAGQEPGLGEGGATSADTSSTSDTGDGAPQDLGSYLQSYDVQPQDTSSGDTSGGYTGGIGSDYMDPGGANAYGQQFTGPSGEPLDPSVQVGPALSQYLSTQDPNALIAGDITGASLPAPDIPPADTSQASDPANFNPSADTSTQGDQGGVYNLGDLPVSNLSAQPPDQSSGGGMQLINDLGYDPSYAYGSAGSGVPTQTAAGMGGQLVGGILGNLAVPVLGGIIGGQLGKYAGTGLAKMFQSGPVPGSPAAPGAAPAQGGGGGGDLSGMFPSDLGGLGQPMGYFPWYDPGNTGSSSYAPFTGGVGGEGGTLAGGDNIGAGPLPGSTYDLGAMGGGTLESIGGLVGQQVFGGPAMSAGQYGQFLAQDPALPGMSQLSYPQYLSNQAALQTLMPMVAAQGGGGPGAGPAMGGGGKHAFAAKGDEDVRPPLKVASEVSGDRELWDKILSALYGTPMGPSGLFPDQSLPVEGSEAEDEPQLAQQGKIAVAKGYGPNHAENSEEGADTDTVPAMLTPREAVLNRNAAELAGRKNIQKLNAEGNKLAEKGVDLAEHDQSGTDNVGIGGVSGYSGSGTSSTTDTSGYDVGSSSYNPSGFYGWYLQPQDVQSIRSQMTQPGRSSLSPIEQAVASAPDASAFYFDQSSGNYLPWGGSSPFERGSENVEETTMKKQTYQRGVGRVPTPPMPGSRPTPAGDVMRYMPFRALARSAAMGAPAQPRVGVQGYQGGSSGINPLAMYQNKIGGTLPPTPAPAPTATDGRTAPSPMSAPSSPAARPTATLPSDTFSGRPSPGTNPYNIAAPSGQGYQFNNWAAGAGVPGFTTQSAPAPFSAPTASGTPPVQANPYGFTPSPLSVPQGAGSSTPPPPQPAPNGSLNPLPPQTSGSFLPPNQRPSPGTLPTGFQGGTSGVSGGPIGYVSPQEAQQQWQQVPLSSGNINLAALKKVAQQQGISPQLTNAIIQQMGQYSNATPVASPAVSSALGPLLESSDAGMRRGRTMVPGYSGGISAVGYGPGIAPNATYHMDYYGGDWEAPDSVIHNPVSAWSGAQKYWRGTGAVSPMAPMGAVMGRAPMRRPMPFPPMVRPVPAVPQFNAA